MTDLSLYLTNVNITVAQDMEIEKNSALGKDFECVELGELEKKDQKKEKTPRRVIHFSSGETMEEYSTDEEEEEEPQKAEKRDLLAPVDASKLTWGPYVWFQMWRAATSTVSACDYLGEKMASLFGINSAKYQYAIDEYYRSKKQKEEEDAESRLSEEAERSGEVQRCQEPQRPKTDQPEATAPQVISTTQQEQNSLPTPLPNTCSIPAEIGST
ncbi:protein FAM177A1-like [Chanos chanos]|uniref:Protein FAM177A1-like n=1 Tax=Chanos chanos TaxID=29144 RepID=A0A6J2V1D8_CHACN|nr:protein FAM177A1-like [Chanos chanos]